MTGWSRWILIMWTKVMQRGHALWGRRQLRLAEKWRDRRRRWTGDDSR